MSDRMEHKAALPIGYGLHEYRIAGVLGHGGVGITYSAHDATLGKTVAVKEYLPDAFAVRKGAVDVAPKSAADSDPFRWGLERFLDEARILARFRHPNVVGVHRYFEANGTAYMVMEFIEGDTLAQNLRNGVTFDASALKALALALLDGLEAMHRAGYLHRGIKPSNIMLRPDGQPVLLGIAAARPALGRGSRTVTGVVAPGNAPYEQYCIDGNHGPWTDIHALAVILRQIVAGRPPVEAFARLKNDPLPPARTLGAGRYPDAMLTAIDWALSFDETRQPQCVADWRKALVGVTRPPRAGGAFPGIARAVSGSGAARRRRMLLTAVIAALVIGSGAAYGVYEYRALQAVVARESTARAETLRDAEKAAELQAAALAREIVARQDAERLSKANEAAAEQARLADEKRKVAAAARAAKRARQAEVVRRRLESEEQTRKALAAAEARREAEAARQAEAASRAGEAQDRRRGPHGAVVHGPVFGRTVTRDQMGRPRILTGPINPPSQPQVEMRQDDFGADRPAPRDRLDGGSQPLRLVQQDGNEAQKKIDAEAAQRRAAERAREQAERDQLQRDIDERRRRQQDDLRLLEEQRLRDRR